MSSSSLLRVCLLGLLFVAFVFQLRYFRDTSSTDQDGPVRAEETNSQGPSTKEDGDHDFHKEILEKWREKRKELLSSSRSRKVLWFSHMRGGSSISSQIFNKDPSAVLWHEPLSSFFMAQYGLTLPSLPHDTLYSNHKGNFTKTTFSPIEQHQLTMFFDQTMNCHYSALSPTVWMHWFNEYADSVVMKKLVGCRDAIPKQRAACGAISNICGSSVKHSREQMCPEIIRRAWTKIDQLSGDERRQLKAEDLAGEIKVATNSTSRMEEHIRAIADHVTCLSGVRELSRDCLTDAEKLCKEADLHLAEVNRIKMDELEEILTRMPDLFVFHYVRDPRAIAASRIKYKYMLANRKLSDTIKFVCIRMESDIDLRKELEKKYPGVIRQVRYEDLVREPIETARRVYEDFGRTLPSDSKWPNFTQQAFHGDKDTEILRTNGSSSIDKWKSMFSASDHAVAKEYCGRVLEAYGYTL